MLVPMAGTSRHHRYTCFLELAETPSSRERRFPRTWRAGSAKLPLPLKRSKAQTKNQYCKSFAIFDAWNHI